MKRSGLCDNCPTLEPVFPGEIAGASLKLARPDYIAKQPPEVFPGEIAGASLKPLPRYLTTLPTWRFSPAKSPGPH